MNVTHRSVFLDDVKAEFPELTGALNSEHGLLHCEMHAFHEFVQSMIASGERDKVVRAFKIIEHHFVHGNDALTNAIAVSFLEHLDLGVAKGSPSWAYNILPANLKGPYEHLRKYHGN